jgi:hypothetical protein
MAGPAVGVVGVGDFLDRVDPEFHLVRQRLGARAAELEATRTVAQATATLGLVPLAHKRFVAELARGSRGPLGLAVARAEREYPFLALAMVEEAAADICSALREEAWGRLAAVEALEGLARGGPEAVGDR